MTAEEMFKELGYECRYFKRYIYYTSILLKSNDFGTK